MDNLTHALVGAALSRAGLERRTPLATATLVVAANAPDVDVFAYVNGPYFGLAFRRGITHGVPALAVLPFAVAGLVLAWDRGVRRRGAPSAPPARPLAVLALAAIGVVTHPILDWMNNYGMRWWLPFDGGWSYGDTLFIIDPWLWLALGGAVYLSRGWPRNGQVGWAVLASLTAGVALIAPVATALKLIWLLALAAVVVLGRRRDRLTRVEPGSAGDRRRQRTVAVVCAAAALYVATMRVASVSGTREVLAAAERDGLSGVEEAMVFPAPADPFDWAVAVRTRDGFVRGSLRWLRSPRVELHPEAPVAFRSGAPGLSSTEVDGAIGAAARDRDARSYLVWARFPYYRVEPEADGYLVRIADIRYDGRGGSIGGVDVHLPRGAVPP